METWNSWENAQPSELTAMLELRSEISKTQIKTNDDPELPGSALNKIWNMDEDNGSSVDDIEMVVAFNAAVPKDYFISTNTWMGQSKQDSLQWTVEK